MGEPVGGSGFARLDPRPRMRGPHPAALLASPAKGRNENLPILNNDDALVGNLADPGASRTVIPPRSAGVAGRNPP